MGHRLGTPVQLWLKFQIGFDPTSRGRDESEEIKVDMSEVTTDHERSLTDILYELQIP